MTDFRKPAAFKITPQEVVEQPVKEQRKPRAVSAIELIEEDDVFDAPAKSQGPDFVEPKKLRWTAGRFLISAVSALLTSAVGLWINGLIRDLFAAANWLGFAGVGIFGIGTVALLIIGARELRSLSQLKEAQILREEASQASTQNDVVMARKVISKLNQQFANVAQTAKGRQILRNTESEVIDGADLIALAEQTLLKPMDQVARKLILDSAKRVSIVTAVSPRAIVDVAYVVFECARLIRRLSELYGGNPGTLGLLRLSKNVIGHLAVTGSIAVGDSVIQQLVGHGVAAKISARLGEGLVNGMMTARVGISAMELVRPMVFSTEKRPKIADFMTDLTRMGSEKPEAQ